MKKAYKKLSKHAQNEWTILEGKNVHSGPATKVQVSVKILQNFLYLKIKMFPTESNLCRFSTEWIIWKILLKFTKKKPVGKSSQVKLEAHAQTCHCHEQFLKTLHLTSKETQGKYAACLPDLEHRVLDLIWNASFFNETSLL